MAPQVDGHRGDTVGVLALDGGTDFRCAGIPATSQELPRIRHALAAWARRAGVSDDHVAVIVLAAYEAMANVVDHAYPHEGGTFDLYAACRPGQGWLWVTVSDRGCWQPPLTSHGWGMLLINALATHASVEPHAGGTTVQMSWSLLRA
ncbi:MAG TPA: ATP-binding protein [Pseudonocardiaceae bacterium]|nr:ATP-binding protein [Pseudonocardiaceae bacterium]